MTWIWDVFFQINVTFTDERCRGRISVLDFALSITISNILNYGYILPDKQNKKTVLNFDINWFEHMTVAASGRTAPVRSWPKKYWCDMWHFDIGRKYRFMGQIGIIGVGPKSWYRLRALVVTPVAFFTTRHRCLGVINWSQILPKVPNAAVWVWNSNIDKDAGRHL